MPFYYLALILGALAFMAYASPIANANAMPAVHELSSRAVEVEAVKLKAREGQYALYCCDQEHFQVGYSYGGSKARH